MQATKPASGGIHPGFETQGRCHKKSNTDAPGIPEKDSCPRKMFLGVCLSRSAQFPLLTSSGGHCSGRYASYWNAFLFLKLVSWLLNRIKDLGQQGNRQNYSPYRETDSCSIRYNWKHSVILHYEEKFPKTFVNLFLHVYSSFG